MTYAKILIPILCITTGSSVLWALSIEQDPKVLIEQQNQKALRECLKKAINESSSDKILQAKRDCNENLLSEVMTYSGQLISWTGKLAPIEKSEKPKQWEVKNVELPAVNVTTVADSQKNIKKVSQAKAQENYSQSGFWMTYDLAIPLIRKYEWLHLKAYWDYKGYSIGYGTRAKHANEVITQAEADRRLWSIVKQLVTRVQRDFPTLTPKQQAGLVSFKYNCNSGYNDVKKRGLWQHKYWCRTAWGERLQWLVNRRLEEQNLIFN